MNFKKWSSFSGSTFILVVFNARIAVPLPRELQTRLPQVAVQTHKGTYGIFPNLLKQCLLLEYCMGQSAENIV